MKNVVSAVCLQKSAAWNTMTAYSMFHNYGPVLITLGYFYYVNYNNSFICPPILAQDNLADDFLAIQHNCFIC